MKKNENWQLTESTIFKRISDELVVIQLDTGEFYYFNSDAEPIFEALKTPRSVSDTSLSDFVELLSQKSIVRQVEGGAEPLSKPTFNPVLLRQGEKRIDELAFLCP